MDKKYLVLLSTAAAASYLFGEMDLLEANAAPMVRAVHAKGADLTGAAATQFANLMDTQLCDALEAKLGLSDGDCTTARLVKHARLFELRPIDLDEDGVMDAFATAVHTKAIPGNHVATFE